MRLTHCQIEALHAIGQGGTWVDKEGIGHPGWWGRKTIYSLMQKNLIRFWNAIPGMLLITDAGSNELKRHGQ